MTPAFIESQLDMPIATHPSNHADLCEPRRDLQDGNCRLKVPGRQTDDLSFGFTLNNLSTYGLYKKLKYAKAQQANDLGTSGIPLPWLLSCIISSSFGRFLKFVKVMQTTYILIDTITPF